MSSSSSTHAQASTRPLAQAHVPTAVPVTSKQRPGSRVVPRVPQAAIVQPRASLQRRARVQRAITRRRLRFHARRAPLAPLRPIPERRHALTAPLANTTFLLSLRAKIAI